MPSDDLRANLRDPYLLDEVILHAPFWTFMDIWPKRHVYFVRHLRICDRAKKVLARRKILRIGRYFVKTAQVDYRSPIRWHEKLKIRIFVAGLFKEGKVPLLKYELHSLRRKELLAEARLLYFPPLSERRNLHRLFFDEALKERVLASVI